MTIQSSDILLAYRGSTNYKVPASQILTYVNGNQPCISPPYACKVYVNTSCVTDFSSAWSGCSSFSVFPCLNLSQGTNFTSAWSNCANLTEFYPQDFSAGAVFTGAWLNCTLLTSFPANAFDNCSSTSFLNAWLNCALSQTSVDNILVSINTAGTSNGTLGISGGTSSPPGAVGIVAKNALVARGWVVTTN